MRIVAGWQNRLLLVVLFFTSVGACLQDTRALECNGLAGYWGWSYG